jgi:hypothetical protein
MIALEALDALGVALAPQDHRWTERERDLYERAIVHITFSAGCTDSDWSASGVCVPRKPSHRSHRASAQP